MQAVESAVIAVAGMGTRLGLGIPKCMIDVEGQNLLTRLIDLVSNHVSRVHLVVGYREEMIIDYCSIKHKDVIIVRNPDYRETNTAYSYALGANHTAGKVLFLDGDLLISPCSFRKFMKQALRHEMLLGLTQANSDNAVFAVANGPDDDDVLTVEKLSQMNKSEYEWGNVLSCPAEALKPEPKGFVFEQLVSFLPLPGVCVEMREADTASDLSALKKFAKLRNL